MIGNTIKTNGKEVTGSDELTSSDLLVLDYDDEAPTCVDMRSRGPSPSYSTIIPPANHDERDVYILTKRAAHAPKKQNNDRVNFNDVMTSSLPAWTLEMPEEEVEETPGAKLSSLLPVAIPNDAPAAIPTAPTTNPRALYAALIGSLSAAAIAFALWTPNSNASVPQAASANEAQNSAVDLPLVQVEGTVEVAAVEASKPSKVAPTLALAPQAAVPAVVAPAPVEKPASVAAALPVPSPAEEEAGPFDKTAASAGLNSASTSATGCRQSGDPSATVSITVTFASNGRVTNAVVDGPPFGGTKTGGCIAKLFRAVRVSPFSGSSVTVHKTFQLH